MHPHLRVFAAQLIAAVLVALVPVVFTAFVTMPLSLQGHPGEPRLVAEAKTAHMT